MLNNIDENDFYGRELINWFCRSFFMLIVIEFISIKWMKKRIFVGICDEKSHLIEIHWQKMETSHPFDKPNVQLTDFFFMLNENYY